MPLMVTGGFRSRQAMEAALEGSCDVIGLGRPLCWQPDFPRRLLAREVDRIERMEDRLRFAERGWRSPSSSFTAAKVLNAFGAQSWYYCQLFRLADGKPADLERSMLSTLLEYVRDELRASRSEIEVLDSKIKSERSALKKVEDEYYSYVKIRCSIKEQEKHKVGGDIHQMESTIDFKKKEMEEVKSLW